MKRTIVWLAALVLGMVYAGSVAAYKITTDDAVLFDDVEIGSSDGMINYKGNSTLRLGDGIDDAVLISSGTGDGVTVNVNGGTTAMTLSPSGVVTVNGKLDMGTLSIGGTTITATPTQLNFVDAGASIQGQLNSKQPSITGAATTITGSNLPLNRALISDGAGKVGASAVSSTELGYLSGVTSPVQTQLNNLSSDDDWLRGGGALYPKTLTDSVGVGTSTPATLLEVYDSGSATTPAVLINQLDINVGKGDASLEFMTTDQAGTAHYTIGIDNDDGDVLKVSDQSGLSPTGGGAMYADPKTVLRVHPASASPTAGVAGIVDLNHQSRARWFLIHPQLIPVGVWTAIEFDAVQYDEHSESAPGGGGSPWIFTVLQEGYYQVNARTEYDLSMYQGGVTGWVTIGVFVNGMLAAQGNNLDVDLLKAPVELLLEPQVVDNIFGPAPNVSDVLILRSGDQVAIYTAHTLRGPAGPVAVPLVPNPAAVPGPLLPAKSYVSIHKSS